MTKYSPRIERVSWQQAGEILASIREQVFIKEQKVPPEMEWDDLDYNCHHLLAYDHSGNPVGTVRLLKDGHIGRMAVLKHARGKGIGSLLLTNILELASSLGLNAVYLHAQSQAVEFYKKHRFQSEGNEFLEAGIAHYRMRRNLKL